MIYLILMILFIMIYVHLINQKMVLMCFYQIGKMITIIIIIPRAKVIVNILRLIQNINF